jgi:hypothetical protein
VAARAGGNGASQQATALAFTIHDPCLKKEETHNSAAPLRLRAFNAFGTHIKQLCVSDSFISFSSFIQCLISLTK